MEPFTYINNTILAPTSSAPVMVHEWLYRYQQKIFPSWINVRVEADTTLKKSRAIVKLFDTTTKLRLTRCIDFFVKPAVINTDVFIELELIKIAREFEELSDQMEDMLPTTIKKVIFKNPATIVFWTDGTKTVVKANNEPYDKEKGLAMAYVKKHMGNRGNYYNQIKKWVENEEE